MTSKLAFVSTPRSSTSGTTAGPDHSQSSAIGPTTRLQLAPWGTDGGQRLAFAMSPEDSDAAFARVRATGVPYGDSFHDAGKMRGPGEEQGARGSGKAIYLLDPNEHLVETGHY
jgi:hypothetical protein